MLQPPQCWTVAGTAAGLRIGSFAWEALAAQAGEIPAGAVIAAGSTTEAPGTGGAAFARDTINSGATSTNQRVDFIGISFR
jgi:hypothetical protein